jgi:hypothetical protein
MRLPNSAHLAHPWVIGQIVPDFELLDVWALPVHGGPDDFAGFLERMASLDPTTAGSAISRFLFWVRLRLGDLFDWDDATKQRSIPGATETSLRDRLPDHLRESAKSFIISGKMRNVAGGFVPLYETHDECAAEIANDTVHGVLHLGWVEEGDGRYRAQMAIYVKARGRFGKIYMKLIEPFRHLIVYPALMRTIAAREKIAS